jgi:hypothetical protein
MKRGETRPLASLTDFQALSIVAGGRFRARRYDEFPANARGPLFSYEKKYKDNTMNQSGSTTPTAILMTLLGVATLGGFTVAFTSTKTGRDLRKMLNSLVDRLNSKPGRSDPTGGETVQVAFI